MPRKRRSIRVARIVQKAKPKKPLMLKKKRVLLAIPGTGGVLSRMAKKLECNYQTLWATVRRPGWESVREAMKVESERIADKAEQTIEEMIDQRLDLKVAANTARWLLERKHIKRGYSVAEQRTKVTIEGGKKPVKVEHSQQLVDVDQIPLDLRIQLLSAIEKGELEKGEEEEEE